MLSLFIFTPHYFPNIECYVCIFIIDKESFVCDLSDPSAPKFCEPKRSVHHTQIQIIYRCLCYVVHCKKCKIQFYFNQSRSRHK